MIDSNLHNVSRKMEILQNLIKEESITRNSSKKNNKTEINNSWFNV